MEADVLHMLQARGFVDGGLHVLHGDAELVLVESRCNFVERVCVDVGIDAEGHARRLPHFPGQLVDDSQLGKAFNVEAGNVVSQRRADFGVGFAHTCEHNFGSWETIADRPLYFAAADAVGTVAGLRNDLQQARVGIGFDGIMNVCSAACFCSVGSSFQRRAQQVRVVEIERCREVLEFFNRECTGHFLAVLNSLSLKACRAACLSFSRIRKEMLWSLAP